MLRITESIENGATVRLRLDGTVTADSFAELDRTCTHHLQHANGHVILDMAGVSFMQVEPAQKLARIRGNNLQIINCSPFIAALLDTASRVERTDAFRTTE